MGRQAATVEYLIRLVDWAGGKVVFCQIADVKPSNLSAYLKGSKNVTWKWLRRKTELVLGQPPAFVPIIEGFDLRIRKPTVAELPKAPGVYGLFDSAMRVVYFGKATSLYVEIRQTLDRTIAEVRPWNGKKDLLFKDISAYVSAYEIVRGDSEFRHDVEALGLRFMVNNTFNKKGATFKRTS